MNYDDESVIIDETVVRSHPHPFTFLKLWRGSPSAFAKVMVASSFNFDAIL
jgi:hypothetical protein